MQDDGLYRGHRLVDVVSPQGLVYRLPSTYRTLKISETIRKLREEGWSRAEISRVTGIRYQHVRNVLEQQPAMPELAPPRGSRIDLSAARGAEGAVPPPPQSAMPEDAGPEQGEGATIREILEEARRRIAALADMPMEQVRLELHLVSN
jgi:hypothetical protein